MRQFFLQVFFLSEGIEYMAGTKEDETASTETMSINWKRVAELSDRLQEVTGTLKS